MPPADKEENGGGRKGNKFGGLPGFEPRYYRFAALPF